MQEEQWWMKGEKSDCDRSWDRERGGGAEAGTGEELKQREQGQVQE